MTVEGLIPARFLTLTAHLTIVIVVLWARVCFTENLIEYN